MYVWGGVICEGCRGEVRETGHEVDWVGLMAKKDGNCVVV